MLTITNGQITTTGPRAVVVCTVEPKRAAAELAAERGLSSGIATACAYGALATKDGARALARGKGLIR